MSEAPCKLLKLDATALHFYPSKMRWKTLCHLLCFLNTSRNDNFVLWGFLKGPRWAEKFLNGLRASQFLVGPAQIRTIPNLGQSSNVVRNIYIQTVVSFDRGSLFWKFDFAFGRVFQFSPCPSWLCLALEKSTAFSEQKSWLKCPVRTLENSR